MTSLPQIGVEKPLQDLALSVSQKEGGIFLPITEMRRKCFPSSIFLIPLQQKSVLCKEK